MRYLFVEKKVIPLLIWMIRIMGKRNEWLNEWLIDCDFGRWTSLEGDFFELLSNESRMLFLLSWQLLLLGAWWCWRFSVGGNLHNNFTLQPVQTKTRTIAIDWLIWKNWMVRTADLDCTLDRTKGDALSCVFFIHHLNLFSQSLSFRDWILSKSSLNPSLSHCFLCTCAWQACSLLLPPHKFETLHWLFHFHFHFSKIFIAGCVKYRWRLILLSFGDTVWKCVNVNLCIDSFVQYGFVFLMGARMSALTALRCNYFWNAGCINIHHFHFLFLLFVIYWKSVLVGSEEDLEILLVLLNDTTTIKNWSRRVEVAKDERTNLFQFMTPAGATFLSSCGLDLVYTLAMKNLDVIIF